MKKRVYIVLRQLLAEPSYATSQAMAKRLGLSRRSLLGALDEADALLKGRGLPVTERVPNRGIRLADEARPAVAALIEEGLALSDPLDLTDAGNRRFFILFAILCVDTRCTTELLAEWMGVSERTVTNDMSALRRALDGQGVVIDWDKHEGYQLRGNAFCVRNCMLTMLREACPVETCREVVSALAGLYRIAGKEFDRFDVGELAELARDLDDVLPNYFERSVRWTIVLQLTCLAVELPGQCSYDISTADRSFLAKSANYELARFVRVRTEELLHVKLDQEEDSYLGMLLQSLPTRGPDAETQNYPFELEVLAQRLILSVGEAYRYDFREDPELFGIIVGHLIPLSYRLLFKAQIVNPLLADIVAKYPRLHRAVVAASAEIERSVGAEVSEDECSFLTLYFASSLEKLANSRQAQARVIVVCNAGNAVSRLLQYKLVNAFNVDVVAVTSTAGLREAYAAYGPVDLVIGVVDVDEAACPGATCLRVSPFLTDDDYQRLRRYLGMRVSDSAIPDAAASGERGLMDLLPPACFEVREEVRDMDDLIACGGELLRRAGLCDEEYPRQMISAAHCFGPLTTILIAPGIIMPHAGISEHVLGTGFSFVLLRRPVTVNGKDVTCAISLCTRDKRHNQHAIQQLGMLLSRSEFANRVNGVSSYEELANLVTDCLEQAERKQS